MSAREVWSEVAAWLAGQTERTIETSCARLFLGLDVAWKIKRPVRLPFLDFSTLEQRRWALGRELAFNRRWAADIYRAVRPVTRAGNAFVLGGQGEVVEWLLEMRRFDPDAVLANRPWAVDGTLAETLGRMIARAHGAAPVRHDGGGTAILSYSIATNEDALDAIAGHYGRERIARLTAATLAGRDAMADLLESRRREGFSRECHGDLHLGNILLEGGSPTPFDCIEFNDRLSRIDVLYDAAFPIMDLAVRGRGDAANRLLNAYLDEAARTFPPSLWSGLATLPLFLSVRAAVRGHVTAASGDAALAESYLAAAASLLEPSPPRLFAVGGLSGTGKTSFARFLAPLAPGAAGAVVLRSDEIRKRRAGVGAFERLPPDAYNAASDARTYGEMLDLAGAILVAGCSVVLDATFLAREARERAAELAARLGVSFAPVWLNGYVGVLRARLATRQDDSSDATVQVLERQLASDPGELTWPRVSAEADFAVVAREKLLRPRG